MACFSNRTRGAGCAYITLETIKSRCWLVATTLKNFITSESGSSPGCLYLSNSVPTSVWRDSLMMICYLFTFGPDMERPGCPCVPCWPFIPRSPWKVRFGRKLKIHFISFTQPINLQPTTCRELVSFCGINLSEWHICHITNGERLLLTTPHTNDMAPLDLLTLTFGPEGPETPGDPCKPRIPLGPWSPLEGLQHTLFD